MSNLQHKLRIYVVTIVKRREVSVALRRLYMRIINS
jgi:hypothetical protein